MSPFGFTPNNSENSGDDENNQNNENDQNKNNGDNNFDLNNLMAQFQSEIAKLGAMAPIDGENPFGFISNLANASNNGDVLPKETIRQNAKSAIFSQGSQPIGANDQARIQEAFSIANIWLDEATLFPSVPTERPAISPIDWLNDSISGWQETMTPLAAGLTDAVTNLISEATDGAEEIGNQGQMAAAQIAAMGQVLRAFIGQMLATQLGQVIGAIGNKSSGAHDAALPLMKPVKPALLPQNVDKWGADLNIERTEIEIFHALRENAVARLFAANPWLVSYLQSAITEYGRGIHIDLDAMQRQAEEALSNGDFDPNNPQSFTIALNSGIFTPEESPAQKLALEKLETALALIDGWVDEVITLAAGDRLPSLSNLREMLRRERATNSPTQQLFRAIFNLEVSPKLAREASTFFTEIRTHGDLAARDKIWSGILPNEEDLKDPKKFLTSIEIPDDLSGLI